MSTQSPTPPTPKGPRNNRRYPKRSTTPHRQSASLLTTPPSSPPRNFSPGDPTSDYSNNAILSKKKNPRSGKKPRDVLPNNGHRYTSSQPNISTPSQVKGSPHYAGPTFHASPAPSALPIPSFFSKSVPDSDLAPVLDLDSDALEMDPDLENTPSKPKPRAPCNDEQKPTPLDFLFKAALEARNSKGECSPEVETRNWSPAHTSFSTPSSQRKHDSPARGIFQLDMENSEMRSPLNGSYATSYKDRMNALRSISSPSRSVVDLDEDRRRAKTEALKDLLLNPRPQRPSSSASPVVHNRVGVVNGSGRTVSHVPHFATPLRTTSGPPAPNSYRPPYEQKQSIFGNGSHPPLYPSQSRSPEQSRTQYSTLRQEVSPSDPGHTVDALGGTFPSPHTEYRQSNFISSPVVQRAYGSPVPQYSKLSQTAPASHSSSNALDTKKMEDDLRRILKLDAAPSIQSSGVQSSFA